MDDYEPRRGFWAWMLGHPAGYPNANMNQGARRDSPPRPPRDDEWRAEAAAIAASPCGRSEAVGAVLEGRMPMTISGDVTLAVTEKALRDFDDAVGLTSLAIGWLAMTPATARAYALARWRPTYRPDKINFDVVIDETMPPGSWALRSLGIARESPIPGIDVDLGFDPRDFPGDAGPFTWEAPQTRDEYRALRRCIVRPDGRGIEDAQLDWHGEGAGDS